MITATEPRRYKLNPERQKQLPPPLESRRSLELGLVMRPLSEPVNHRSFLRLLTQLTEVGEVTDEFFTLRLAEVQSDCYQRMLIVEIPSTGAIVATGSLIVEPKFIHQAGLVGHIEDLVVEETLRGFGLGTDLMHRLIELAAQTGCYKCILDCKQSNVPFYERLGFCTKELMMARYFDEHERCAADPELTIEPVEAPGGLLIRSLRRSDIEHGFLELLSQLTVVGDIPACFFEERLGAIESSKRQHMLVIEQLGTGQLVATATLLIERKFIHQAGLAGHIEDVVSDINQRGQGLGKKVILAAIELARRAGCYKVILDCEEKNTGFYEKCGFVQKEFEMALYLDR